MKTDAFEADLRQALALRAAEVPQTTIDRLRRRNYRPRARNRVVMASTGLVTAAAVGAAVAVTALAPGSHQASPPPRAQLTAWTVVKLANGNIRVTIRELRDPAGLQRRLRADGVPATVTFLNQQNPACHPWPGAALEGMHTPAGDTLFNKIFPGNPGPPGGVIVIRPSALPSGGGVQLAASFGGASIAIGAGLVQASPECTGS